MTIPRGATRAILSAIHGIKSLLAGIGGGSFGVPLMNHYSMPIHRTVATASGFGFAIALPSVLGFLLLDIAPQNRPPFTLGAVNIVAFVVVIW